MARTSKNIEFIKDKVGKLFIKANSIVTNDNVSIEDKIKVREIIVSGNTGSGAAFATEIDATKYVVLCCYPTNDITYSVTPFVMNNRYYFSVSIATFIVNDKYGMLGVFNTNVEIKVFYIKK